MKYWMIVIALLCSSQTVVSAASWADIKKSGVIKIANDGEFPPFYEGITGKMEGFEIDLGNEIFRRLGVKVQWVKDDFDFLLGNMNKGKYDAVMASLTVTPERQKIVDFTSPEYCTGMVFIAKPGTPTDIKGLQRRPVSVLKGSSADKFLKDQGFTRVTRYNSVPLARSHVAFGTDTAILDDEFAAMQWIKSPIAKTVKLQMGKPVSEDKIAIALPKQEDELRKLVNTTLEKIMSDGTYAKMSQKWLQSDMRCK